jgi:hypothetical protein
MKIGNHMRHTMTVAAAGAVAIALLLGASPAYAAGWTVVSAPPPGQAYLLSVSTDTNTDGWAVGNVETSGKWMPLIDHWNGSSWTESTAPGYSSYYSATFDGVSASSTSDAWAVGYYNTAKDDYYPTTAHWNGTSWSTVSAAQCTTGGENVFADLTGVADISSTDAYAIGECVSHASQIMEQWNGTAWSTVTLPDPDPSDPGLQQQLYGVSADSASDVWAVGTHLVVTGTTETFVPWSVHWNGSSWTVVSMPAVSSSNSAVFSVPRAVDAISPTNVWAVGDYGADDSDGGTSTGTVIWHYNGTAWSMVSSPTVGTAPVLHAVTGLGTSQAWAVGYATPAGATEPQTFSLSWNGSTWSVVSSPDEGTESMFVGAATTPGGTVNAVGWTSPSSGGYNTLAADTTG